LSNLRQNRNQAPSQILERMRPNRHVGKIEHIEADRNKLRELG